MQVVIAFILSFITINFLVVLISTEKIPSCAQDQLHKIEYYKKVKEKIFVKLITINKCTCDVPYKVPTPDNYVPVYGIPQRYSANIYCTKDNTKELVNKTTCEADEECKHDVWNDYGEDQPGKLYKDHSISLCECNGTRRCMREREGYLRTIYTCKKLYKTRPNKFCGENSISKVEYFRGEKGLLDKDSLIKIDTLFFCRCVVLHNYGEILPPIEDPKNNESVIVDHKCPNKFHVEYETLESCKTGELCGIDHFNEYGTKRSGMKYFDYFSKKCICDRFRKCIYRQKTSQGDIHYSCELIDSKPDNPKLQECNEEDIYKEEVFFGTFRTHTSVPKDLIKIDTLFRCHCDHERMESPLLEEKAYPGRNMLFRKYTCRENFNRIIKMKYCTDLHSCTGNFEYHTKEKIEDCLEYQICRRDFTYYYGKDRDSKLYGENVRHFCNCHNGLECKPVSKLSTYYPTDPYDEVISYRCIKMKLEKPEPCVKNQSYMTTIDRLVSNNSSLPVRLNTFIDCICDSANDRMLRNEQTRMDPGYPDVESIATYACPSIPTSSVNDPCRDYGICRKGFRHAAGLEDPGRYVTQHYTTYCKCEPGFSCENVGEDGNTTIHRCVKKKPSSQMEICKDNEIFRVHVDLYSYGPSQEVVRDRLNTFKVCKCLQKVNTIGIFDVRNAWLDRNFENHLIQNYKCPKPKKGSKRKEVPLPYCTHRQICKTQHFEKIGREKPELLIELNSTEHCKCHYPGICQVVQHTNLEVVSQCLLLDQTMEPNHRRCIPGQLYMEEIHHNISTSNGEFKAIKNHTIHNCICEQTLYTPGVEENITITNHPIDEQRWNRSFYCPHFDSTVEEVESCIDYAVCQIDIYTDYGENFGRHVRYLRHRYSYCKCDRDRVCEVSEKGYPSGASTIYDTYRCKEKINEKQLAPCSENQDFLVVVKSFNSSTSPEVKLNTFLKCLCDHDDSYETLEFTSVVDPSLRDQSITTYKCSGLLSVNPVETKSCSKNDVCLEEFYDDYGRERSGGYVFHSKRHCTCGPLGSLDCILSQRRDMISIYQCETKICKENEDCRILEYSAYTTSKKLEKNETLCHCSGQCNIRPIGSTFISTVYGNATVHYSCMLNSDKNSPILSGASIGV